MRQNINKTQWTGQKLPTPLLAFILILIIIVAVAIIFMPSYTALVISSEDAKLTLALDDGEDFGIQYMHSVNKSPVIDTVERAGDTLIIRSSLYQTYGAGIPILSDEVGSTYTETDEGFLLTGIDTVMDEINLITGTYSDHHLLYREQELILKEYFGEQTLISIKIAKVSLYELYIQ